MIASCLCYLLLPAARLCRALSGTGPASLQAGAGPGRRRGPRGLRRVGPHGHLPRQCPGVRRPSPRSQSRLQAARPARRPSRAAATHAGCVGPQFTRRRAGAGQNRPFQAAACRRFRGPPIAALGGRKGLAAPGLGECPSSLGGSLSGWVSGWRPGRTCGPRFRPHSLSPAPLSSAPRGGGSG